MIFRVHNIWHFQVYPFTWEIMIDNVFLDGVPLPMSNLTPPGINVSALIDTVSFSVFRALLFSCYRREPP